MASPSGSYEAGRGRISYPPLDTYSFSDLIAIQTLIKLRENRIQPRQIGRAMASLRKKLDWVKQPLSELRIVSDGKKIAVHVGGQKMEAISGQILFDFDTASLGGVKSFPERKRSVNRMRESEAWFQKGLELEETGAPVAQAIEAYRKVLELNPGSRRRPGEPRHHLLPPAEIRRGREVLPRRDRGRLRLPAGAIQSRKSLRRAGPHSGGDGALPRRACTSTRNMRTRISTWRSSASAPASR